MILVGLYMYMQLKTDKLLNRINSIPLIVLVLFGLMALYNGVTSTCSISILLQEYLN